MNGAGASQNRLASFRRNLAVFVALFVLVVALQAGSGAYHSEFAGYPDEPAHYATSVMVRDYLLHANGRAPMAFAREYYGHYPKIAFGHWPPLLYVVQGLWMIAFGAGRSAVFVELAITTALAAFAVFLAAARRVGGIAGGLASALLVCLPLIQTYSDEEMAESLLLLTTFISAVFFTRYLENGRWQDSLCFGLFCSLAILTKGNGWELAMIPPLAVLLTRRWGLLKRGSFWIPVPIVVILCIPWQIMTLELARRGWTGGDKPSAGYTVQALWQFLLITRETLGWGLTGLALLGIVMKVILPFRAKAAGPFHAVLFGLFFSTWMFHSVVPAGVESRKMINALPALLVFALAGAKSAAEWISLISGGRLSAERGYAVLICCAVFVFAAEVFSIPEEQHFGFSELSSYIESRPELKHATILVSSERDGEGLLISELMMRDHRPDHVILRANKVLASTDWNGNIEKQYYRTPEEILRFLKRENVRAVVMDFYPPRIHYPHQQLLLQAIRSYPDSLRAQTAFGGGKIQLYRVMFSPIAP